MRSASRRPRQAGRLCYPELPLTRIWEKRVAVGGTPDEGNGIMPCGSI